MWFSGRGCVLWEVVVGVAGWCGCGKFVVQFMWLWWGGCGRVVVKCGGHGL